LPCTRLLRFIQSNHSPSPWLPIARWPLTSESRSPPPPTNLAPPASHHLLKPRVLLRLVSLPMSRLPRPRTFMPTWPLSLARLSRTVMRSPVRSNPAPSTFVTSMRSSVRSSPSSVTAPDCATAVVLACCSRRFLSVTFFRPLPWIRNGRTLASTVWPSSEASGTLMVRLFAAAS